MRISLWHSFLLLLLISCAEKNSAVAEVPAPDEEQELFIFDLESAIKNNPQENSIDDLIEEISYIPLETNNDALFSNVYYNFAKIGGDMFISGGIASQTSPVFRFDSLGRFIKQVTYRGRGPNEVLMPVRWYANAKLEQINIVDIGAKMVIVSTDSDEKSTIAINRSQGLGIVPLNDSTFVSALSLSESASSKTYLSFIDVKGRVIHTMERKDDLVNYNLEDMPENNPRPHERYWLVSDYKGNAMFHDIFNDTLYRIKSRNEITPHLVFKRGKLIPDPNDKYNKYNKERQVYFVSLMEGSDHVFLNYFYEGKIFSDIWSKKDGSLKTHTVSKSSTIFDFFFTFELPDGSVTELPIVYVEKDRIYGVLDAVLACKFLPGVQEDDNPVIVVAKLKR